MFKSEKKRKNRIISKAPGTIPAFLLKTYEILENPIYNDIISWNKEGTAFIVKKINDFSERILPTYFKHNNFASFVRQLNMYDFHKTRHENNENEFRHKYFKRGQRNLLLEIKRKSNEIHQSISITPNQIVPSYKEPEMDKCKKDYNLFLQEALTIKARQQELENFTKAIFAQNNRLIQENKMLWTELMKNREKAERKMEKLVFMLFHLINNKGINSFNTKKNVINAPDISKFNAESNLQMDTKVDPLLISSNSYDQSAISLFSEFTKLSQQEQEKLYKKLTKFMPYKTKNESDYNIGQLVDELAKGNKIFGNYINYIDECEKTNKNLIAHLIGVDSNYDDNILPEMDFADSKKKLRKKKLSRRIPAISGDFVNERNNLDDLDDLRLKKFQKIEAPLNNLNDQLEYGIPNEEFKIKCEYENDLMIPNLLNSPANSEYYNLNPLTPLLSGIYGTQNMMMLPPIQDQANDYTNPDTNRCSLQNNFVASQQPDSKISSGTSRASIASGLIFNTLKLNEGAILQKQLNKNIHTDIGDKTIPFDESGLQTPPIAKNQQAIEPFSPALYMNSRGIVNGVRYLPNAEDLVPDQN